MPSTHPYARLVKSRPVAMRGFATRASACLALAAGAQVSGQTTTLSSAHPESGGWFGSVVASVPDTDGDGTPDIAVGAFRERVGTILQAGRVTIHSGATGAILRTLVSPTPELLGFFGSAVAGVPDVNGDGRGDILVGASYENRVGFPDCGRAYLFSGATGQLLRTLDSPTPEVGGAFGCAATALGDVTGDGKGDLVLAAYKEDPNAAPMDAGRVYIFSGASGALYKTLVSPVQTVGGGFGISISAVPDATGDGKPDLVIGASGESPAGLAGAGRAYLFNGVTGTAVRGMSSPNRQSGGSFGISVAGVPDVNGDGRGDLIVGAPFEGNGLLQGIGRAYLISGADGVRLRTFSAGAPESGDLFGSSVAGLPDMNGDGRGDIAIGAALADPGGAPTDSGRAFIYSGATGAFLRGMASPKQEAGGAFGTSIAGLPDVNGNGKGDIVVGAPLEDTPNISDVGRVYLFRN